MDFFPMPQIGDRKPVMSVFAEDTIMIHAKSPNKDAAAEFVNWMVSKEAMSKKLEIDKPYPSNSDADLSRLTDMEQRLGKAMSAAGSFTFMHVDHATPPSISDKFLDAVQGVLAGAMSPKDAMQLTEDAAIRARGKV
jgi:raffinose/stachyose/melibiose transport system substrate-binding protein